MSSTPAAKKKGKPRSKAAANASIASTSAPTPKLKAKRQRPSAVNSRILDSLNVLPKPRKPRASAITPTAKGKQRAAPDTPPQSDSEVSLLDGVSEDLESDDAPASDPDQPAPKRKKKSWPAEQERLRRWRKLSVQERECVSSEGGLVWRTAIPLLNSMPKNIRSMVAGSLTNALNRIDAKLETSLVPPLARLPSGALTRRELPSSMLSWRLEEEGALLQASLQSNDAQAPLQVGISAETAELEAMLLPEAEQIVELKKTLEHQARQLQRATDNITQLKKQRRLAKSSDDHPATLKAHESLTVTAQKHSVDATLASFLRM